VVGRVGTEYRSRFGRFGDERKWLDGSEQSTAGLDGSDGSISYHYGDGASFEGSESAVDCLQETSVSPK
jgi:hypothetical protein